MALQTLGGLSPSDAEARVGLLHSMVLCVQQVSGPLRALSLQPVLVQLLDPSGILWHRCPNHAVQSFHLQEELPAGHICRFELAPTIQAACGRTEDSVVRGCQAGVTAPSLGEELPEGQAMTST